MRHTTLAKTYLNILPLGDDKLDMFAVFNGIHPQITKWTELFYNQTTFETDIHAEFHNSEQFRNFYFESKNIQKTRGQHPFGFGFPFVFDKDTEGERVIAPLFIWYLNIKPHPNRRDSWLISFDDNCSIAINEYLVEHVKKKHKLDLTDYLREYIQKRPFTYMGFQTFCKDLAGKLSFPNPNINAPLRECPGEKLANELASRGDIIWHGALGLFHHGNGSLSQNVIENADFQNFTWTAEHAHEFSVLPEDLHQRTALRTVLRNKITVVEGGHGTGKTHLGANILLNALSNGQKTAVISDDMASLMQVQNELVKLGLGNLTFLLKDIYHDKKLLLDVIRNEQYAKSIDYKEEDFKIALKQARRFLSKSDDTHNALGQSIFGDANFAEVVGYYLASQRRAGRELLANHLSSSDYEFSKTEYERLRKEIEMSEPLFKNVNTLKHPLNNLNAAVFADEKSGAGRDIMTQKLTDFIGKFKALHHRFIALYDTYAQKLMNHYESYYIEQRDQMRHLKEAYSDYEFQYGEDFKSSNLLRVSGLYASSIFSDRSKNVLTAKEEAVKRYNEMKATYDERKHFNHEFLKNSDRKDFKKLKINLDTFESLLRGWRKALPANVQEELQRLNSKTAQYFDKPLAVDIQSLENDLDSLIDEVNDAKIYAEPLSHKMLTLPKRMLFVEETIEKLEESQLNMRDFDTFYDWQRFWIAMPENGHRLIGALTKVKPKDWTAAFDSWYFHNTLVVNYQSNTLGNDDLMNDMNEVEDRLRTLIPSQIAAMWNDRKKTAIKNLKAKSPEDWKLFFAAKNHQLAKGKYLKDILKGNMQTLLEIYPVLLLTPQVATQIVEPDGKEFDLVVFDNAQNLDVEQVIPIMKNTEGVVVLTEDALVHDSFTDQIIKKNAAVVQLNHLHRPLSETTRRINQAVFYPDLDIPFRQSLSEQSVAVRHVSKAKFVEKTRTNDAEITEIVEILKEILATPFNTYPRIGIVTMTKQQRNTLNMTLLNIVQKTLWGWEKIEQLQRNGLTILNVNELTGLQFDILVVSGTFDNFEKMSFPKSEFRQLLNCFTKKLYWVNSIPRPDLERATTSRAYEMPFLMSNLIFLAETIEQGNTPQYETVFSNLRTLYGTPKVKKDSVFVKEVIVALSDFIDSKRLKTNFVIQNHTFPLVIVPQNDEDRALVVRIDGRLSTETPYFNADWERRLLKQLDGLNVGVLSIWSYNWWKNEEREAQKLASEIKIKERGVGKT